MCGIWMSFGLCLSYPFGKEKESQGCYIGGAIRVARDDSYVTLLNEELVGTLESSKSLSRSRGHQIDSNCRHLLKGLLETSSEGQGGLLGTELLLGFASFGDFGGCFLPCSTWKVCIWVPFFFPTICKSKNIRRLESILTNH